MSSEWTTTSLLAHYEVRSGLSKPAKDFGSGYPFLTFKDVFYNYFTPESLGDFVQSTQKEREGCSILRGDVFLTRTSETMHELGMSCVALRDYKYATFNGFCKRLRPKPESDLLPEYVGYYLRSPKFRQAMLAMSTMSTRASLNNEMIGRLEISFPSRKSQIQISEILKSLDDRITLLRETNTTLEAIAQALFKSWFVDFDPVHAKMQGRAPEGMDEATAALFPDSFEESELGAVPKGWKFSELGRSFILTMGQSPPGDTYNEEEKGLPFYQGRTDFGFRFPSQRIYCDAPTRLAKVGDTLVSVRAPVGDVNMAIEECSIGRGVAAVRHPNDYVGFTFYAMRALKEKFKAFDSEGTVFGSINKKDFQALPVIQPSETVLTVFDDLTSPLDQRIVQNEEQIRSLITIRDSLLPRLISGQLQMKGSYAG